MTTAAPSGVLTFLFTDIEGSTRRWEADPDAMRVALETHNQVLRDAIERHAGHVFTYTGDGMCAVFSSPRSAIDTAVDAQRALELPVRMGIATGEAELRGDDYFGTVLNRTARVMAAGHGAKLTRLTVSMSATFQVAPSFCQLVCDGNQQTTVSGVTRVCVVGSVNVDQFFRVTALPQAGETILASAMTIAAGGKGGNQAVAAARAGARVQFVGAVGTDPAGAGLRAHLTAKGIGLDGLQELPVASGSAVILVDDHGENMIVVAPGANGHLTLASAPARAVVADCEVLLVQL